MNDNTQKIKIKNREEFRQGGQFCRLARILYAPVAIKTLKRAYLLSVGSQPSPELQEKMSPNNE